MMDATGTTNGMSTVVPSWLKFGRLTDYQEPSNGATSRPGKSFKHCRYFATKNGNSCFSLLLIPRLPSSCLQTLSPPLLLPFPFPYYFSMMIIMYTTKNSHYRFLGCRAGDACPFLHDSARLGGLGVELTSKPKTNSRYGKQSMEKGSDGNESSSTAPQQPVSQLQAGRQYVPSPIDKSRVVQRPMPRAQLENPREFQVQQLRRRFSPTETTEESGTAFAFTMEPSDPDFPFEMEGLDCVLHVPLSFPHDQKPHIDIKNKDMGRGFQINVERGFDRLVERSPQSTLLGIMNALNKQLESLLTEEKAETIKILPNSIPTRLSQFKAHQPPLPLEPKQTVVRASATYKKEQMRDAEVRRLAETLQLEARLGRLPLFSKSSDGIAYNVPIQPRQHEDLPVPLRT